MSKAKSIYRVLLSPQGAQSWPPIVEIEAENATHSVRGGVLTVVFTVGDAPVGRFNHVAGLWLKGQEQTSARVT